MSIALATAKGRSIPNSQAGELTEMHGVLLDRVVEKHGAVRRAGSTLRYNCHGLTFASRRTGIDDPTCIPDILLDDRYIQVEPREVLPGDIVLYRDPTTGDIEHSAIVVEPPDQKDPLKPARVVSKWAKGPEVIHNLNNCPYNPSDVQYYRVEYDS